jgi:hypothetical protein
LFATFIQPGFAQEEYGPLISAVQQGNKTIFLLSGNWTADAKKAELTFSSTLPVRDAVSSKGWNSTVEGDLVRFRLEAPTNATSKFAISSNASDPTFDYVLSIDSSEYSGSLQPLVNSKSERFANWTDNREGALSAFVPDGWQADLQIIRPYKAMTGFVFFVRGEGNALGYLFYPYMPLHITPGNDICETLGKCAGAASTETIQKLSFGNAPVVISEPKDPMAYFQSEILPQLRTSLDGYEVHSTRPLFALEYNTANRPESDFLEGLEVNYGFDASDKKIKGKAAVFVTNTTSADSGIWNGIVVGIESSEKNFERDFQRAAVTLLTLSLSESWASEEQAVLNNGAAGVSPGLKHVSSVMANMTLAEFGSVINTAAHGLVRSEDDIAIVPYVNTATSVEMHLPEHNSVQNWYLYGDELVGRKIGRNIMNGTAITPLYR